jgi:hypothetical protein
VINVVEYSGATAARLGLFCTRTLRCELRHQLIDRQAAGIPQAMAAQ